MGAPQAGQEGGKRVPHLVQKLAPAALAAPQAGHLRGDAGGRDPRGPALRRFIFLATSR